MWVLIVPMLFRLYIWLQQAIAVSIDDDVPFYKIKNTVPISDLVYRGLRIVGCICIFYTLKWWFLYWIWFYVVARIFKKIVLYFEYKN